MKLLQINVCCGVRSTGRIAVDIAQEYEAEGWECKIAYGRLEVPERYKKYAVPIGGRVDSGIHGVASMVFDKQGLASKRATREFLRWASEYDPDVLWLHVIHGYYINYELLFDWIKSRPDMKVKWTFHDCWAFTGHCCYFSTEECEKWKTQCSKCPLEKIYPSCYLFDSSYSNHLRKKAAFTGVRDMTIVCPSQWIADLTKESFLSGYSIEVKHNKVDLKDFVPTYGSFKENCGLSGTKIVSGIASSWDRRKGLSDYVKLSQKLTPEYSVVLVGLTEKQIKGIKKELPEAAVTPCGDMALKYVCPGKAPLLCMPKTHNVSELAEIYTSSYVYANLSYEENYPTTNLEAKACGTKVVTYRTGGSPESVPPENVIEKGDIDGLVRLIMSI